MWITKFKSNFFSVSINIPNFIITSFRILFQLLKNILFRQSLVPNFGTLIHFVQILSFFSNPIFFFIFQILSPRLNSYDKYVDWIDLTIEMPFEERDRRFYIKYKKYAYKYRTNIRRLFYTLYPLISSHFPWLCGGKFLE